MSRLEKTRLEHADEPLTLWAGRLPIHIYGHMPIVRFVSRREIRKQALEDAARAHREAADLVSAMAEHE